MIARPDSNSETTRQLKQTVIDAPWSLDELVIDQKMIEANALCSGPVINKIQYLIGIFGSRASLLSQLYGVLRFKRPLKALHLDKYESLRNAPRKKRLYGR